MNHKLKQRIINALVCGAFFTFIGIGAPYVVEQYAPTSYFIKINDIHVSDMKMGEWKQEITIKRDVRRNTLGFPTQVLVLVEDNNDFKQPILVTATRPTGAIYEKGVPEVKYIQDWSGKFTEQGTLVSDELNRLVKPNTCYYWTWKFDFKISEYRSSRNYDIVKSRSNTFCVKE